MVSHLVAVMIAPVTARWALGPLVIHVLLSLSILLGNGVPCEAIAFVAGRTGFSEIYVMDVNRGFIENLTDLQNFALIHNDADYTGWMARRP
jgi:hypothetical protein